MSLEDEVEVLRSIPLFANLAPAKLKLLGFTSERVVFSRGQELCRQGEVGDAAYVIIEGSADIVVDTPGGELSVAQVERNSIVGEIAILCDVPRTATVRALSELQTLKITKDRFLSLTTEFPEVAVEVMRVLAQRLAATTAELTDVRKQLQERDG